MMAKQQNLVCFSRFDSDQPWKLETYEQHGGYQAWRRILAGELTPEQIISAVKASGLRRGRLSHGPEVEFHAQNAARPEVHRLQFGRE